MLAATGSRGRDGDGTQTPCAPPNCPGKLNSGCTTAVSLVSCKAFLQAGLLLKNVACCGSSPAPSPHVATEWTKAVPSPPTTLHSWAAFCPGPGNPDSSFVPLKQGRHAGQVWAPKQGNRWKEAKPVWPVLCANTIIHDSGKIRNKSERRPRVLSDKPAWGQQHWPCLTRPTHSKGSPTSCHP